MLLGQMEKGGTTIRVGVQAVTKHLFKTETIVGEESDQFPAKHPNMWTITTTKLIIL